MWFWLRERRSTAACDHDVDVDVASPERLTELLYAVAFE